MKDLAKQYAAQGYATLWLYGAVRGEDGTITCSCPAPDNPKFSHGKHPMFGSHGSKDATVDSNMIDSWPDGQMSLGLGLTDTLVAIDIDDPSIAARLLEPEYGLRDLATVSTTGRGLHIILRCAPTTNGVLKYRDTRQKIGEVRAAGLYIVLPPSLHMSGRNYTWLGATLLDDGPTETSQDGWGYVKELLGTLGIEIADKREALSVPRDEPIEAVELPFTTDNATLLSLISPTHPVTDRSASLFHLACELVRETQTQSLTIDRLALAGVLKHVDRTRAHPKGPKYAWRDNADDYYWDAIVEAERTVAEDQKSEHEKAEAQARKGSYYYTPEHGTVNNRNPKNPKRISNFRMTITDRLEVWDEGQRTETDWVYALEHPVAEPLTIRLRPKERAKFREAMIEQMHDPRYIVEEGMWNSLETAVQHMSADQAVVRRVYASPGWVSGVNAFLLPSLAGAITPDGIDPSIQFDIGGPNVPARMQRFGASVLPPEGNIDLANVARTYYTMAPAYITVPLLTQVLAAPLASLGADKDAVIVHLFSRTGAFKTSMARVAISLYGQFLEGALDSWTGTANSISATMHRYRDLPLVIDDYKQSMSRQQVTNLIQNYADRTARTRQGRDQVEQRYLVPRCLAISTGESIWEGQESARARTLLIDVSNTATLETLIPAQEIAKNGHLQALGYSWLQWLTTQGQETLRERLSELREQKRDMARRTELGQQHPRIVASIASLLAVDRLFEEFLTERVPGFLSEYKALRQKGWAHTITSAQEQAQEAADFSPYNILRDTLRSALETEEVKLRARLSGGQSIGGYAGEIVGFVDETCVWMNKQITLGWLKKRLRSQGEETTVTWEAFLQEAYRDHGAVRPHQATHVMKWEKSLRMVSVPRSDFLEGLDTTPIEHQEEAFDDPNSV